MVIAHMDTEFLIQCGIIGIFCHCVKSNFAVFSHIVYAGTASYTLVKQACLENQWTAIPAAYFLSYSMGFSMGFGSSNAAPAAPEKSSYDNRKYS